MADTDVLLSPEELNADPELLWLRRPDGTGAIFAGEDGNAETAVTGNLMPYIDLCIGEIPLYPYQNEHILSFTHSILPGGNRATLSLLDPTNFFLERLFRFAYGYLGYPNYVKIRYGWTNGIERWGTPDSDWLIFKMDGLTQTMGLDGTRWTMTLKPYIFSTMSAVKVKANVNLAEATPENLQDWIVGTLLETGSASPSVRIKMFGKFQQRSNVDTSGHYQTSGDETLYNVLKKILAMWQTTNDEAVELEIDPYINDYALTSGGRPSSIIFIYDRKYLDDARSQYARDMNGGAENTSPYKECHALVHWPNTDGGVIQVQMVSDLNYLAYAGLLATTIDRAGNVVDVIRSLQPQPNDSPAAGERGHPAARIVLPPGTQTASGSSISGQQAATAAQLADKMKNYAQMIEITTMGEPWFQSSKLFKRAKIGLQIDELFNLDHFVPDFDGRSAGDLANTWQVLNDSDGVLSRAAAESGIFTKDSRAYLNHAYIIKGVEHAIQGSIFTSRFNLSVAEIEIATEGE